MTLLARSRGFTLIELLVVVAIIAMLASVVLTSLNTARSKSRDARRLADLKELQAAVEQYVTDNGGNMPQTLVALAPTYIATIPTDPNSSGATVYNYGYAASAGGTPNPHYCIGARLENQAPTGAATSCKIASSNSTLTDPTLAGNGANAYYVGE